MFAQSQSVRGVSRRAAFHIYLSLKGFKTDLQCTLKFLHLNEMLTWTMVIYCMCMCVSVRTHLESRLCDSVGRVVSAPGPELCAVYIAGTSNHLFQHSYVEP